jgi:aspartyl/asparaginyl-tRNA synthetase
MTIITIEDAGKYDGQEVTIRGWLYNLREAGKLLFPIFRDGTGIIQGVVALSSLREKFEPSSAHPAGTKSGSRKLTWCREFPRVSLTPSS